MSTQDALAAELHQMASDMGRSLKRSAIDVAAYVAQQSTKLGTLVGQPGFEKAQAATLDSCRLYALGAAVREADDFDGRVLGAISLGIRILATAGA